MTKVSCIIAAYNEQAGIGNVLAVASQHPGIDEIIVVDDGSTDGTKDVAASFERVRLIVHPHNKGKSAAIHTGIAAARGDFLLFLDGDLVGLTIGNIINLVNPVLLGSADVSISLRKNSPRLWQWIGLDYISGERVLHKSMLKPYLGTIGQLSGFSLEVFMNRIIIKNKCRIQVVSWINVESPYKYKKLGLWQGVRGDVRMISNIMKTTFFFGSVYQIIRMTQLRID